jgi:hypothetical protein
VEPLEQFGNAASRLSRNPLGIIALFIVLVYGIAGLVLGTAKDSLTADHKTILIWFLVVFPVVVLILFAWLVSKHHEKLYAPSDYREDESFLRSLPPAAQRQRLQAEVQEIESGRAVTQPEESQQVVAEPAGELSARVVLSEELAIRAIEREYGASVSRQAGLAGLGFDGMFARGGRGYGIEVKYIPDTNLNTTSIAAQAAAFAGRLRALNFRSFTIILALVGEHVQDAQFNNSLETLKRALGSLGTPVELKVFSFSALKEEFGV